MKQVTVSSKFQAVIPREVRESMDIQPGTRVGDRANLPRGYLDPRCPF